MYPVEVTLRLQTRGGAASGRACDEPTESLLELSGTGTVEHVSLLVAGPEDLRAILFVRADRALGAEQAARLVLQEWCARVGCAELLQCSALLNTAPRGS